MNRGGTAHVAVVTGANRGIGREVARQLGATGSTVHVGCRDVDAGDRTVDALRREGIDAHTLELDVASRTSIDAAARAVAERHDHIDVLVNNAAIHYDSDNLATRPDMDVVREALDTNLFGAWYTTLAFLELLRAGEHGRIVNVSSGAGSLADMGGGLAGYHLSKVSLNALTRMWAAELASDGILVNSVCPGWVATDMGGRGGRPIPDGAAGVVWAATLGDDGPTGGFFRDGRPIAW